MTMRSGGRIVLLMVAIASAGCDKANLSPTAPSPAPSVPVTTTPAPPASIGPQVIGTVFDTAFRWLPGVMVEVLSGPQAGTSTITGPTGEFLLSGNFTSPTEIRMTSADHVS